MATLLPVGAYVRVTERRGSSPRAYIARVVRYAGGKYELGSRFAGWDRWLFADGGSWAFVSEVTEISEAEATAVPTEES